MKPTVKHTLAFGLVAVLAAGAGLVAGAWLGYGAGTRIVATLAINTQVHHVMAGIETLRALRAGRHEEAVELTEHRLDGDIASLLPERRTGIRIAASTRAFIDSGLRAAGAYRDEHPRPSRNTPLDRDVARALTPTR